MSKPAPPPLSTDELRLLAHREKRAADKRAERARHAQEKAAAATAPNPTGYVVPPMPGGMKEQRRWLRDGHNAYSKRLITIMELTEMRRSVTTQAETYKAGAIVRQSHAAMRQAEVADRQLQVSALVEQLEDFLRERRDDPLKITWSPPALTESPA